MTELNIPRRAGPILHFRGHSDAGLALHVIVVRPADEDAPAALSVSGDETTPELLTEVQGARFWRYQVTLTAADTGYAFEGQHYDVVTALDGDLRVGFVSCNGEEHGDLHRDMADRNAMWLRLWEAHRTSPLALLIQGGDQIYADEVTDGHPLTDDWPKGLKKAPTTEELADLYGYLERRFVDRYLRLLASDQMAPLLAQVPTLAIWDDHDICDGWGSLPEKVTDSAIGQTLFAVARQMFLLFQQGMVEADIPTLFPDPTGASLGWRYRLPGLTLLAPDLRSQRQRHQVMGPEGWSMVESTMPEKGDQTFLISSVPLLGPRLSIVEGLMMLMPRFQKYEDDLRDQWQSRAHRKAWQRMLREVLRMRAAGPVTAISGEIHLATRAEMTCGEGVMHQLVASGISHPAPTKNYARGLGLLAGLGEAPLKGHPIRILPLPGQSTRYIAERNFLVLERQGGTWEARWHLEESGVTPALVL